MTNKNPVLELCEIFNQINKSNIIDTINWADLGSFGSADSYLLPLTSLEGNTVCVEGRENCSDSSSIYSQNPYICSSIIKLNSFISGKTERRFFFESREGGGSSFYPSQDIFSRFAEDKTPSPLTRSTVQTSSLNDLLEPISSDFVFIKADLEGAEIESISSLLSSETFLKPSVLEVELNVGERGPSMSFAHGLSHYESLGYRLIDLRKTYFYPKLSQKLDDSISADPIYSPYFQGCLHQADLLLVDTQILSSVHSVPEARLLSTCLILALYRQFNLASFLLDQLDTTLSQQLNQSILPAILNVYRKAAQDSPSSLWGYNPLFNWLKST